MTVCGTPPLGSGNVQKVKSRLEKTKKLQLPGKFMNLITFHKKFDEFFCSFVYRSFNGWCWNV